MTPTALQTLAYVFAILGLGCFLWPVVQRLRGRQAPAGPGSGMRSKLWWAGFVLTAAALMLQRLAAGG